MTVLDTIKVAKTNFVPKNQYQRHIQDFTKHLWCYFLDSVNSFPKISEKNSSWMFGSVLITMFCMSVLFYQNFYNLYEEETKTKRYLLRLA